MMDLPKLFDSPEVEEALRQSARKPAVLDFDEVSTLTGDQIDERIREVSPESVKCNHCGEQYHETTIRIFGAVQTVRTSCACGDVPDMDSKPPLDVILKKSDLGPREAEQFRWTNFRREPANQVVYDYFKACLDSGDEPASQWLHGPTKSGKSHLAIAFAIEYAERYGQFFQYLNMRIFNTYIPNLQNKESWAITLEKLVGMSYLIMDHLGETALNSFVMTKLTEILQMRYDNGKKTLYVSRAAFDQGIIDTLGTSNAAIINSDLRDSTAAVKTVRILSATEAFDAMKQIP